MLLLRSGDRAMISDAAARPIAIIAVVEGSIAMQKSTRSLGLSTAALQEPLGVRYGPPSFQ